jgi:hypothetical protein
MDYDIHENPPVFVKIDKSGLDRFRWFIKNRSARFEILKN